MQAACLAGPPGPIPADHAMLRRADLAKAADGAVAALVALLKRPAVDTLNGPLRIVAVQVGLVVRGVDGEQRQNQVLETTKVLMRSIELEPVGATGWTTYAKSAYHCELYTC